MLDVTAIPAFSDNYIWMIADAASARCALVDPGDAAPALEAVERLGLALAAILITHHHHDHTGGISGLLRRWPHAEVFGPAREKIAGVSRPVREGDGVAPDGMQLALRVLDVPGHTAGHVAYVGGGALFCGDTLFGAGCGRLFEGSPQQMNASLAKLAALRAETLMYCAHEYTADNIGFAKWVEPGNPDLLRREADTFTLLDADRPSLPSRLDLELRTNPFLRVKVGGVIAAAEGYAGRKLPGPAEVFGAIRRWKDSEYD